MPESANFEESSFGSLQHTICSTAMFLNLYYLTKWLFHILGVDIKLYYAYFIVSINAHKTGTFFWKDSKLEINSG